MNLIGKFLEIYLMLIVSTNAHYSNPIAHQVGRN